MPENALALRPLSPEEITAVYRRHIPRHFPRNECRPLLSMLQLRREGRYAAIGAFAGETLAGYAMLCGDGAGLALLDYLAVMEPFRCRGVGGALVRRLLDRPEVEGAFSWRRLLVEIDDPDFAPNEKELAVRERRLAFYRRATLCETGVRVCLFGVRYRILRAPATENLSDADCAALARGLYAALIPPQLLRGHLTVEPRGE